MWPAFEKGWNVAEAGCLPTVVEENKANETKEAPKDSRSHEDREGEGPALLMGQGSCLCETLRKPV